MIGLQSNSVSTNTQLQRWLNKLPNRRNQHRFGIRGCNPQTKFLQKKTVVTTMSSPKVAIVFYSMYGHIAKCTCSSKPDVCSLVHVLQWLRLRRQVLRKLVAKPTFTSTSLSFLLSMTSTDTFRRVEETLSSEILAKMYAPAKPSYPNITPDVLATYDAFILGVPTRYGNMSAQWKVCPLILDMLYARS